MLLIKKNLGPYYEGKNINRIIWTNSHICFMENIHYYKLLPNPKKEWDEKKSIV